MDTLDPAKRSERMSRVRGKDTGPELAVRRPLGSERLEVVGELAVDAAPQVVRVAVHDPARFAAAVLQHELRARGLVVDELPDVVAAGEAK